MTKKKPANQTKNKIIDATLKIIMEDGLIGISARNIAKAGDFNQALIFYHFDSIENLLLASVQRASKNRFEKYKEELSSVKNLSELAELSNRIRAKKDEPDSAALAILAAGWSTSNDLPEKLKESLEPWNKAVEEIVERVFKNTSVTNIVSANQLAKIISALFLGLEIESRLDTDGKTTSEIFDTLNTLATLLDSMLPKVD